MALQAPQPLGPHHSTADFDCGDASLNRWLQQRALANQGSGATRTFVVGDGAGVVALDGTPLPMAIADRNCLHGSHSCFCWAFDRSAAWRPCFSTPRQPQQCF
jgi:hypothetical protein